VIRVIVKLILIFVLLYAGVHIWYGRLEQRLALATPQVASGQKERRQTAATNKKHKVGKANSYQVILSRNIFDALMEQKDVVVPEESAKPEEKAPEKTTLQLILQGTIAGSERDARAIIVDKKEKRQELYQIGDAVQGALITAIERGKVILEVDGKKQFLLIKERKGGNSGSVNRPSQPVFVPRKPVFAKPETSKVTPPLPRSAPLGAVPHRRIRFLRGNKTPAPDSAVLAEPVAPLIEGE